jgi:thiamine biosynthesis lipoprotein
MGMPISLALRGRHTNDDRAAAAWVEVMSELRRVGSVFSTFRSHRVARGGDINITDWPPECAEVLALGEAAERETNGAFRIRRAGPGGPPVLDATGVARPWAIERAMAALRALPDTDFCLSAGGDVACRTMDPASSPWRIGIEDPADPRRILAEIPVRTGAVATAGTAPFGEHGLDTRSGRASSGIASVTVVDRSPVWAHIDATAAYAHGYNAAHWLRARPGRTALIVWNDGSTTTIAPGRPTSAFR